MDFVSFEDIEFWYNIDILNQNNSTLDFHTNANYFEAVLLFVIITVFIILFYFMFKSVKSDQVRKYCDSVIIVTTTTANDNIKNVRHNMRYISSVNKLKYIFC